MNYDKQFIQNLDRPSLRRALWLLRRQNSRHEINPAAAQYDGHATLASIRAEYKRRKWKLPKATRAERCE